MEKINTTIIYCTTNTQDKAFEKKIRDRIRQNSGQLPLISVSRLPIKMGKNICVGEDAPDCESTKRRQLLKGLLAAKTEYVVVCKNNCLYSPEYFVDFPHEKDKLYFSENIWVLGDKYWKKDFGEEGLVGSRKLLIFKLKAALAGHKGWKPFEVPLVFEKSSINPWTSPNPIIMVTTPGPGHHFPKVLRNTLPKRALPYWGLAQDLKNQFTS